ncbi:MAG: aminotransferase class V-fold PLP-dependent enzyme [SAR202 cluster bacterium]|jgi:L-cysteine/cystine lyase|nr:aminotransferase class V-fold PLP-dependent enzyme [SAR202 cluster bacterium]
MDVAALRKKMPTTTDMTYLNTGWAGPSPVSVVEAIKERLEYESYNGPTTPEVMDSGKQIDLQAREAVAGLLNVSADEIMLTANTTTGLNNVLNGLPWREGDEIITCSLEHASILLPSYHLRESRGVVIRVLQLAPGEAHDSILSKVEAALTERTRMVFFSHVEFSTGLRMPVEGIRALTKDRGIWMLIDGAQAAGHIPLDLRAMDCDFYSIPGQKWLLGPDETGALYVRQSMIPELQPVDIGYDTALEYDREGGYVPNSDKIEKLLVSTASVPLHAGFLEGLRFISKVGVAAILERNISLATTLKAGLAPLSGVTIQSPMDGPGATGLVSFSIDGADHEEACLELWRSNRIMVRNIAYPDGLRASLDFFNTEDEVAALVDAVKGLVKG